MLGLWAGFELQAAKRKSKLISIPEKNDVDFIWSNIIILEDHFFDFKVQQWVNG